MLNVDDIIDHFKSDKIIEVDKAVELIRDLKNEGKKVGLCHGGFDLLHPGHIIHFESAKKLCDVLVISVTSDEHVSGRKGSGRPIFTDKLRAYTIANLSCIDFVVISNYKKGIEIINILKPSFYIKGPDFITKNTPGIISEREEIKNVGGEMKYTNDPKLATTAIIDYIKNLDSERILLGIDRDGTLITNNNFLGKNDNWREEIQLNKPVVDLLSYIKTKYNANFVVISNQTGVARRFFDCNKVEEINSFIDEELNKNGIKVDNWQYCPDADKSYAEKNPEYNIDPEFIKEKTKRKPSTDMIVDGLNEIKEKLEDFTKVIVLGDRPEDGELATNLNGLFIDVKGKNFNQLVAEFESFFKKPIN